MATGTDELTVYWLTGCGNCTRLKGYLAHRGVDFVAVDVMSDPEAFAEMDRLGIHTMPVLRRGDRWVSGFDLGQVDELVGIAHDPAGRVLTVDELVERAARLLDLAADAASRIPAEHEDDPTPTLVKNAGHDAFLFFRDGQPYVPHATSKLLVDHIAGHGEKFKRFALCADGVHELGFGLTFDGDAAAYGEPVRAVPMYRVVDQMRLTASDVRAWAKVRPACDFSTVMETHYGPQTIHQLLQTMTCSLAQHTRQVVDVVERLGVEVEGPTELDLEGLLMPAGIWE
jgi:glutaredoxin